MKKLGIRSEILTFGKNKQYKYEKYHNNSTPFNSFIVRQR